MRFLFFVLSCSFGLLGCDKSAPTPAPSASASGSAATAPPEKPPRPRVAGVLVAEYERPPLGLVALANPVVFVGRVAGVEPLQRCDCEQGKIAIERVIRDDSKLAFAQKSEIELIAGSGSLGKKEGRRGIWVLRVDEADRRISGWYEAPADGSTEVETALRSVAVEFERGPVPLPPLGIVTTRDGRVVWHRNGRVAAITNLPEAERKEADALLRKLGNLSAAENPISGSFERNSWRLKVAGTGPVLDAGVARSSVEAFAERVEDRLTLERNSWRSAAVIVAKRAPLGDAGGVEVIVGKVLKNRSGETLAEGDRLTLDAAGVAPGESIFLLSSVSRPAGQPAGGTLFLTLGTPSRKSVEAALAELDKYHLSAR